MEMSGDLCVIRNVKQGDKGWKLNINSVEKHRMTD